MSIAAAGLPRRRREIAQRREWTFTKVTVNIGEEDAEVAEVAEEAVAAAAQASVDKETF